MNGSVLRPIGALGLLLSALCFSLLASAQEVEVPPEHRQTYNSLLQAQPIQFTDESLLFAARLGYRIMQNCQVDLQPADRVALAQFIESGINTSAR